ncbi:MAG: putative quinol monooxygenase [Nocardioides sp.]
MAFVVAATWIAKPGNEAAVRAAIETMTPLSRAEPGNLHYQAQVSTDDPRQFLLYELYVDGAAYDAHKASPHFQQHVVGHALALLEERRVSTYDTFAE